MPCCICRLQCSKAEMMMLQSDGGAGSPQLDFEAWRALLRSNCGGEVNLTRARDALPAGCVRSAHAEISAAVVKIQLRPAARDTRSCLLRAEPPAANSSIHFAWIMPDIFYAVAPCRVRASLISEIAMPAAFAIVRISREDSGDRFGHPPVRKPDIVKAPE